MQTDGSVIYTTKTKLVIQSNCTSNNKIFIDLDSFDVHVYYANDKKNRVCYIDIFDSDHFNVLNRNVLDIMGIGGDYMLDIFYNENDLVSETLSVLIDNAII